MQAYVDKFRQLLPKVHQQDRKATQQLHHWVLEFQSITLATALPFPGNMKEFGRCKMDDGRLLSENPQMDDAGILVSNLCCLAMMAA